jgi:CRP/FNR family cyclic AMP-dependent transcriptional regulator
MALLETLQGHAFTQGMPAALVKKLAEMAQEVRFEPDEIVFRSGEESKDFYLVTAGSLSVELSTPVYVVNIQTLSAGEAFGWSALLKNPTLFQVRAREQSRVIRLDGERLLRACEKDSRLASEIYRRLADVVAHRLRATELRLLEFCGSQNHQPARRTSRHPFL